MLSDVPDAVMRSSCRNTGPTVERLRRILTWLQLSTILTQQLPVEKLGVSAGLKPEPLVESSSKSFVALHNRLTPS